MLMLNAISGTLSTSPLWQDKLHHALTKMKEMITEVSRHKNSNSLTSQDTKDIIEKLQSLVNELKGFQNIDRTKGTIQQRESNRIMTAYGNMKTEVDSLYSNSDFTTHFVLKSLLDKLRRGNNLVSMCNSFQEISYEFKTDVLCINANECHRGSVACANGNGCNVIKAVPKMAAVLWHEVSAFLSNSLCRPGEQKILQHFKRVEATAFKVGAYVSTTLDWSTTFSNMQSTGKIFSKLDVPSALSAFNEYEDVAKFGVLACNELKSEKMCPIGYIYLEYVLLKNLQEARRHPTISSRNLRQEGRLNHGHMMELKKDALHQLKLLASIEDVDEQIRTHSGEFSKYFTTLQKYDQGIATKDVEFIKAKLIEFQENYDDLLKKFQEDFDLVKDVAIGANIAQQMENLFAEGLSALGKGLADNIITGVEIVSLSTEVNNLKADTLKLKESFEDNAGQIVNLEEIVEDIKSGNGGDSGLEGLKFIEAYGGYTPKVDEDLLEKNNELWAAYKGKACDLLAGPEGIAASLAQTAVGLTCEKLDGTLAEFFATRESIFNFQFDLVDALAKIIRSHIGTELAKTIDIDTNHGRYSELMLIFFKTQSRLQSEASLYCDKLEYLNHGKTIVACSSKELFTESEIDSLIAYEPNTFYDIEERFVYLPTKPQFPGDEGYINLASLAPNRKVTFRLPANETWLNHFNWLTSGEIIAPFVESFKIYLPLEDYAVLTTRTKHYKTRIQLTAKEGSFVDETSKLKYVLPLENSEYVTVYEEGYDPAKCPTGKEIANPYSLCDNLPFICDTTSRVSKSRVMPTILSRWDLSLSVESGAKRLNWHELHPATNLLVIAKVNLRFPPGIRKRSRVYRRDESAFGCCSNANEYRPEWRSSTCTGCPADSESKMGGYYCERTQNTK